MNMDLGLKLEPETKKVTNTKIHDIPIQIQAQKIKIYVDRVHNLYYLDYYTFESLASMFSVDGVTIYDLGNNTYKGDLQKQSVSVGGYSGLLPISQTTHAELVSRFKEEVEYVDLKIDLSLEKEYNLDLKEDDYLNNKWDKLDSDMVHNDEWKEPELFNPLANNLDQLNNPYDNNYNDSEGFHL